MMNWFRLTIVLILLLPGLGNGQEVVPGRLIVKLESQTTESLEVILLDVLAGSGMMENVEVTRMFPNHKPVAQDAVIRGEKPVDLSRVYELKEVNGNLFKISEKLNRDIRISYAEPRYIAEINFTPNDPDLHRQWYLDFINAYNAWDISKGDSNITVGINDTGTDLDHPDLFAQMQRNHLDPLNGVDDDNNGFIDDYYGWNFTEDNFNVQATDNDHGVHVAGLAAARTNNNEGVAGVGYNTRFITAKTGIGNAITHGYDGIVYLADRGCEVINCSWGSFSYSDFAADVVRYATVNKDALVVAAAGNSNRSDKYYPAAYPEVLGVVATDNFNRKASFSNYGYWAEIAAPGLNIYNTVDDGTYGDKSGTSMASPMVAGAAAVVRGMYPGLSALQAKEQLKATSVLLDTIPGNGGYAHQLGTGIIDMMASVSGNVTSPGVVISEWLIDDNNDGAYVAGDTLEISAKYVNYLNQTGVLSAELKITGPAVLIDSIFSIGVLDTFGSSHNRDNPFKLVVTQSGTSNDPVLLELIVSDGNYEVHGFESTVVNVDYINIDINKLHTTATSNGILGYNFHNTSQGLGYRYDSYSNSLLFEGSLMVGAVIDDTTRVLDRVRSSSGFTDSDWAVDVNITKASPSIDSDFDLFGSFTDTTANFDSMGVWVDQRFYAWDEEGHESYVIAEFSLVNRSGSTMEDVRVGMWTDFDLFNYDENQAFSDGLRRMARTVFTGTEQVPMGAVQLLVPETDTSYSAYCMDNTNTGEGGITTTNGFATGEKYAVLSTTRVSAGTGSQNGNDVIQLVAGGINELLDEDTLTLAFALHGAWTEEKLNQSADSAFARYIGAPPTGVNPLQALKGVKLFPNPSASLLNLTGLPESGTVEVIALNGTVLQSTTIQSNKMEIDGSSFKPGLYMVRVQAETGSLTMPLQMVR